MAIQLNYSSFDRLLHRLAFGGRFVQLAAADIESALFGSSYQMVRGERPIFITSLPRAGTTLLLEALHRFPSVATHTYRDMPFVLAPLLWSRLTSARQRPHEPKERAHGDGVQVGFDSPEAFEEILWRTFWPEKYSDTRIALWTASDQKPEVRAFFADHIRKVIALRRPGRAADGRYLSKNNANIARLDLLVEMFPDAKILLPIRHPLEQARSLLQQHCRFLQMHKEQPFVRRYMGDIGHYEFGELHRPIGFPGLEPLIAGRDPRTLDYWLAYWIASFEHVRSRSHKGIVVSYEACCRAPLHALSEICARLDIPEEGQLNDAAALFRSAPPSKGREVDVDRELAERAGELHDALLRGQA